MFWFDIRPLEQLEQLVLDGTKPGALVDSHRSVAQYEKLGLEAIKRVPHTTAIGRPGLLAAEVWKGFALTPRLERYNGRLSALASEIGERTVAQTLDMLLTYPGNPSTHAQRTEVAIIAGALLGYHNGCVDYYVGTRHEGELESPDALSYSEVQQLERRGWPDPHVLCPPCAADKRNQNG